MKTVKMINLKDLTIINSNNNYIFEIEGNSKYYMTSNANSFIVIEAKYFDTQWKKTSFMIQSILANIEDKKNDVKYTQAETAFSYGIENPVPIVKIDILVDGDDIIPTLYNGITRTNFLLANNAKYLIFEVDKELKFDRSGNYFLLNLETIV